MKVIVWSKNDCSHCHSAKMLLQSKSIDYEERNIETDQWTKQDLLEVAPQARSLPQITVDGNLIGGLPQLRAYLNNV